MLTGAGKTQAWTAGAGCVLALSLALSWVAQRRVQQLGERAAARQLEEAARVLDSVVAHQRKLLGATVGVLSDDSRIRAMVLTPSFDRATVLDLLGDLETASGASVVAMLDGAGVVRAVVGAPEMEQLDLATSSLVKEAMERPAAGLWAFGNEVGVLAAAPVRLDQRVHALFMMGFALEDSVLEDIQQALGATGAVFVGDRIVASAAKGPGLDAPLRAAVELPQGSYQVVGGKFLASSAPLSGSAVTAKVAWLLPLDRRDGDERLLEALSWLPAVLVALALALMSGLALRLSRPGPPSGR